MGAAKEIATICITGMGMVASLGCDVRTACAAARADIRRSQEVDYFPVFSLADGSVSGITGHVVPEVTRGFEGNARLLRLAQAGLTDLRSRIHEDFLRSLAQSFFYLSIADPRRIYTGLELVLDESSRQGLEQEAQESGQTTFDGDEVRHLLVTAAQLARWPGEIIIRFVSCSGHAGVAQALAEAIEDLRTNRVTTAIVAGIDTLLAEDTLAWLNNTGRLRTPNLSSGLEPGEAAAFLVIENSDRGTAKHQPVNAIVEDVRLETESGTLLSGEQPRGYGLERTLRTVMDSAKWEEFSPPWVVTDQNGELHRALDWGNAMVRLRACSVGFAAPLLWYPAMSFGDTGAASGGVAVCMVACAFERDYAPSRCAFVLSSSDGPGRAAIVLRSPTTT